MKYKNIEPAGKLAHLDQRFDLIMGLSGYGPFRQHFSP
jgi:hypothetical protein